MKKSTDFNNFCVRNPQEIWHLEN